jgi:hypothetical protein
MSESNNSLSYNSLSYNSLSNDTSEYKKKYFKYKAKYFRQISKVNDNLNLNDGLFNKQQYNNKIYTQPLNQMDGGNKQVGIDKKVNK